MVRRAFFFCFWIFLGDVFDMKEALTLGLFDMRRARHGIRPKLYVIIGKRASLRLSVGIRLGPANSSVRNRLGQ